MEKRLAFVALDYDSQKDNIEFAKRLVNEVDSDKYGFKINLDSVADFSPTALNPYSMVKRVKDLGKPVFIDMKMWNGGRTMENIAKGCVDLGVEIINMYPHAGGKFMRRIAKVVAGSNTKLFGLTVLTHYTDEDTMELYGKDVKASVEMLAVMNYEFGADGIVVPGTQLDVVRRIPIQELCPGIRSIWYEDKKANDQEQIVTPKQAFDGGADYIVVGSPIRKSDDSAEALKRTLDEFV